MKLSPHKPSSIPTPSFKPISKSLAKNIPSKTQPPAIKYMCVFPYLRLPESIRHFTSPKPFPAQSKAPTRSTQDYTKLVTNYTRKKSEWQPGFLPKYNVSPLSSTELSNKTHIRRAHESRLQTSSALYRNLSSHNYQNKKAGV